MAHAASSTTMSTNGIDELDSHLFTLQSTIPHGLSVVLLKKSTQTSQGCSWCHCLWFLPCWTASCSSCVERRTGNNLMHGRIGWSQGFSPFCGFCHGQVCPRGLAESMARELHPQNILMLCGPRWWESARTLLLFKMKFCKTTAHLINDTPA